MFFTSVTSQRSPNNRNLVQFPAPQSTKDRKYVNFLLNCAKSAQKPSIAIAYKKVQPKKVKIQISQKKKWNSSSIQVKKYTQVFHWFQLQRDSLKCRQAGSFFALKLFFSSLRFAFFQAAHRVEKKKKLKKVSLIAYLHILCNSTTEKLI